MQQISSSKKSEKNTFVLTIEEGVWINSQNGELSICQIIQLTLKLNVWIFIKSEKGDNLSSVCPICPCYKKR